MEQRTKRVDIVKIQMVKDSSLKYLYRTIVNPKDVKSILDSFIEQNDRECFGVLCVDTKNQPTHISTISVGTLNSSLVHPREVFKTAILSNSASVIIFHNHPSGKPDPSSEDISLTKRLVEAGNLLGIKILDHIIIADDICLSMKERMMI